MENKQITQMFKLHFTGLGEGIPQLDFVDICFF